MSHDLLRQGDFDVVLLDLDCGLPGAVRWARHLRKSGARVAEVVRRRPPGCGTRAHDRGRRHPGTVAAARGRGFAAVIAEAPNGGRAALLSAGADIVVRDLGELVP